MEAVSNFNRAVFRMEVIRKYQMRIFLGVFVYHGLDLSMSRHFIYGRTLYCHPIFCHSVSEILMSCACTVNRVMSTIDFCPLNQVMGW